jgi:hypothetical protein
MPKQIGHKLIMLIPDTLPIFLSFSGGNFLIFSAGGLDSEVQMPKKTICFGKSLKDIVLQPHLFIHKMQVSLPSWHPFLEQMKNLIGLHIKDLTTIEVQQ